MLHGPARREIPALAERLKVEAVFTNRDYEPQAKQRDVEVAHTLEERDIAFISCKDQVIFECDEILSGSDKPYSVYTPYKNAWRQRLEATGIAHHPVKEHAQALARPAQQNRLLTLEELGFQHTNLLQLMQPGMSGAMKLFEDFQDRIDDYQTARDFPAVKGPSYLSVHLRFGTVSIRSLTSRAWHMGGRGAETWLNELIWREFYFMTLHHHPRLAEGRSFRQEFDAIQWPGAEEHFEAWCEGRTGYPLVDAAMRQLNTTGYMHNRLRMVTASFLAKDLLVDWRRGEAYFAEKLNDYDLAANNGGWQWAASTGCDAQPWFRIFNPVTQSEKFDAQGRFIRKYVPELAVCDEKEIHAPWKMPGQRQQQLGVLVGRDYPLPIVDHAVQRALALALYKSASQA